MHLGPSVGTSPLLRKLKNGVVRKHFRMLKRSPDRMERSVGLWHELRGLAQGHVTFFFSREEKKFCVPGKKKKRRIFFWKSFIDCFQRFCKKICPMFFPSARKKIFFKKTRAFLRRRAISRRENCFGEQKSVPPDSSLRIERNGSVFRSPTRIYRSEEGGRKSSRDKVP
jgi:hypothetical protein